LAGALSDEYPHAELYEKLEYKDFDANAKINDKAITMLIDDIKVNLIEEIKYSNDMENTISDNVEIILE
jgi:predicted lactoylglutathione lyase